MKQKLLFLLLTALFALPSAALDFDYTYEGQTVTYTVLNHSANTCATKKEKNSPENISGALILPAHPKNGDVEYNLTTIDEYAFTNCKELTSVTIPETVTTINQEAFANCSNLSSVELSNSIIDIEKRTFYGCTGLTSIKFPNSLTSIGNHAFYRCTGLTSIELPNSLTSIGSYAFYYCIGLTSIKIPNSLTSISSYAFCDCTGLTSIELPNSVTKIRTNAFGGCTGLISVIISESVTDISDYAFYDCTGMDSLICKAAVPPTVSDDSFNAFDIPLYVPDESVDAYKADAVWSQFQILPISAQEVPTGDFEYTYAGQTITYTVLDPDARTCETKCGYYNSSSDYGAGNPVTGDLILPAYPKYGDIEFTLVAIGKNGFNRLGDLTSIVIPATVTSINDYALTYTGITSIDIPESVTSIGIEAFANCSNLTSVTIPNSVTSIRPKAFRGCSSLTSIEIPNSITVLSDYVLSNCTGLTSVKIPDSVTVIGNNAFYNCSSLTSVTIPESMTLIANYAFANCSSLLSVTCKALTPPDLSDNSFSTFDIPLYVPEESVDAYKADAVWSRFQILPISAQEVLTGDFEYTYEGQTVTYTVLDPAARTCITKMSEDTYIRGNDITGDLILPAHPKYGDVEFTLVAIGEYGFYQCRDFTSVKIPETVTLIGHHAFALCFDLASIEIPNSVTSIGDYAFTRCVSLTSVTIPNSMTSISNHTFYDCSGLESVTIPTSVTAIGHYAFANCSKLTSVEIPNSVTSIGYSTFAFCNSLNSVEIPASVTSIGTSAFGSCDNLTEIIVDENSENYCSVDGILFSKDTTVLLQYPAGKNCNDYTLPDTVTEIADWAFYGSGLESVTISGSVTSIGWGSFQFCSLSSVVIPASVTSIDWYAFYGCNSLTTVIYNTDAPVTCLLEIFGSETYNTAELIIPEGTLATFMATEPWNQFLKITEKDLSGIENVVIDADAVGIDYDSPYQVYDLNGYLTGTSVKGLKPGFYIIRQGTKSRKILLH